MNQLPWPNITVHQSVNSLHSFIVNALLKGTRSRTSNLSKSSCKLMTTSTRTLCSLFHFQNKQFRSASTSLHNQRCPGTIGLFREIVQHRYTAKRIFSTCLQAPRNRKPEQVQLKFPPLSVTLYSSPLLPFTIQ